MDKDSKHASTGNILMDIPGSLPEELQQELLASPPVSIRRILSKGHSTPAHDWYEQEDNEWVLVVKGEGILEFEDSSECHMHEGDYCFIPALKKHRVKWTSQHELTIWLAVHFPEQESRQKPETGVQS